MAGNPKQKLKLLCVLDILNTQTDEQHPLDAEGICTQLRTLFDIDAERKSIYTDVANLEAYGVDVIKTRTPRFGYFIGERKFNLPEISLLIDAVEAANFITPKKTKQLVSKLESLVSKWQAEELDKHIFIENRNKCANEEILYTIDTINAAIAQNKKISFTYIKRELGENNRITATEKQLTVSPYSLLWENNLYYLIGNNEKYDNLIHLRLDRMKGVAVTKSKSRHFSEVSDYKAFFDVADYSRKTFNMFGGELKTIELKCKLSRLEQVIDRFGDKLYLRPNDDGTFNFNTKANISNGLISWLMQFGGDIEVVSPTELRESICERIEEMVSVYRG